LNKKYNKAVESVSREVMQKIRAYPCQATSAKLENILERSLLFTNGKEMTELDLELPAKTKSVDEWKGVKEHTLPKLNSPS